MADTKTTIKDIIEKLTTETKSILAEKVFNIAAERGIGDMLVRDCLNQLSEENFITQPIHGILCRK
ncbi:MAG: hypothetical protein Q8Q35_04420 [Nanoarchaeota archaeon]|nr:hypothetical protein [Nanoarchaeota archaeon]